LIALSSIRSEEVAELREEEGNFCLSLRVREPGLVCREDPLTELALSARSSYEIRTERMIIDVLLSAGGDGLRCLGTAVTQRGAHVSGGSALGQHRNNIVTSNESEAHGASRVVRDIRADLVYAIADLFLVSEALGGGEGQRGVEHALGTSHLAQLNVREKASQSAAEANLGADGQRRVAILEALDDLRNIIGHQVSTLSAQEAGEDIANLVDFSDDPVLGLVRGNLVLNPSNKEVAYIADETVS